MALNSVNEPPPRKQVSLDIKTAIGSLLDLGVAIPCNSIHIDQGCLFNIMCYPITHHRILGYDIHTGHMSTTDLPANTKHLYNICTMLAQYLRHSTNAMQRFCVFWAPSPLL